MSRRQMARGLTLIELMVVVAILGALVLLVAPSFRDMILMQRLRGINAQIVTDLQFARSEAVARGRITRVNLGEDAAQTCYVIYVSRGNGVARCNCKLGAGSACPVGTNWQEIRTVTIPRNGGVVLSWPNVPGSGFSYDATTGGSGFGYDNITGGLISIPNDLASAPLDDVQIDASIDGDRRLRNIIKRTGRPSVCSPNPTRMQVAAC